MRPIRLNVDRRTMLLGLSGLSLTGCASAAGAPTVVDERALARLPRTQDVLNRAVLERRLRGLGVGVRAPDGARLFIQAGTLEFNDFRSVTPDSLFRIYSMTKPVTGTAAALLIEDGRLALDQPVAEFIPEFANLTVATDPERSLDARPARTPMTIRHLLTHTSGLTYTIMGDGPVQRAYRKAGIFPFAGDLGTSSEDGPKVRDLDEMVARLAEIPLIAEPGSTYHYSVSLDVLGAVVQRASGMSFPDFVQRRLFDPIGMDDTIWRLRSGDADRLMQLYGFDPERKESPVVVPGATAEDYAREVTLYSGGAGLVSSTRDYLDFLSTLLEEGRAGRVRVMRPETARLIRTDILSPNLMAENGGYGFGGWVARPGHPRQGEYGWSGAASTRGWIDPEKGLAGVLMLQAMPHGVVPIIGDVRAAIDADLGIARAT